MAGYKVLRIDVAHAKIGMVLGGDVFSNAGVVLLARDTIITDNAIDKLQAWHIEQVEIIVDKQDDQLEKPLPYYTKDDQAFFDMYTQSVGLIGTLFEEMKTSTIIPLQEFQPITEDILDQVLGVRGVLSRLRQVRSGDEYTFNHSMNVGIYSVLIGTWLNYDRETLHLLAMAGLLHDAGKAKIPTTIIKKPGVLTPEEFNEIKRHPFYGYQMVVNTAGMPKQVAAAILQHHERENGRGYPLKLSAKNIDQLAKVVAVADVYDAVTSNRCYQAKRTPYAAAEIIMKESFQSLDPVIAQKFLENITNYFFADKIRLNDGRIGTIVQMNRQRPNRPLIQTGQGFIDLEKMPELHIVEVIREVE